METQTLPLLSPREAAQRQDQGFYAACAWRHFPIVKKIARYAQNDIAGKLRSVCFVSMRPKSDATDRETFLYDRLIPILDAAGFITSSSCKTLYVEAGSGNSLFALAQYENGVAVEIEMSEELPVSVPPTAFAKAHFEHGHLMNQPLTGYFNAEGSVIADDNGCHLYTVEGDGFVSDTPFIWMEHCLDSAIQRGEAVRGALDCGKYLQMIQEALKK